jgi:hypothetical protein
VLPDVTPCNVNRWNSSSLWRFCGSDSTLNLRVLGSIPRRLTILRFAQSGFAASPSGKLASRFALAKHARFRGGSFTEHFAVFEILSRAAQFLDSQREVEGLEAEGDEEKTLVPCSAALVYRVYVRT